jgi:hypothetical protein
LQIDYFSNEFLLNINSILIKNKETETVINVIQNN